MQGYGGYGGPPQGYGMPPQQGYGYAPPAPAGYQGPVSGYQGPGGGRPVREQQQMVGLCTLQFSPRSFFCRQDATNLTHREWLHSPTGARSKGSVWWQPVCGPRNQADTRA
jgi:hypothetical protein